MQDCNHVCKFSFTHRRRRRGPERGTADGDKGDTDKFGDNYTVINASSEGVETPTVCDNDNRNAIDSH